MDTKNIVGLAVVLVSAAAVVAAKGQLAALLSVAA